MKDLSVLVDRIGLICVVKTCKGLIVYTPQVKILRVCIIKESDKHVFISSTVQVIIINNTAVFVVFLLTFKLRNGVVGIIAN